MCEKRRGAAGFSSSGYIIKVDDRRVLGTNLAVGSLPKDGAKSKRSH